MSQQTHERSIVTEGSFTVTTSDGQRVEAHRELAVIENSEGGCFLVVSEPNQDEPEGDVLAGGSITVPISTASVLDDVFALIVDPAALGSRTR